jgi:flagellar biosynthetic protein FlhB
MPDRDADKSQEATPHRREKARDEGHVARSHDLASAATLLAGLGLLLVLGGQLVDAFARYAQKRLGGPAWLLIDTSDLSAECGLLAGEFAASLLPVLLLSLVAAVTANLLQTGLLFLPHRLAPDWSHVDPVAGFRRVFSLVNLSRLAFGILKVAVVGAVAWFSVQSRIDEILALTGSGIGAIAKTLADVVLGTSLKIAAALLALAAADYAFQKWKHERDLRMTPQEVREEMKDLQGDPHIIARRRHVQRQLVLNRLSVAVPKADVVITNPTELAVAIAYEPSEMAAPEVVAKGAGFVAARIRALAVEHRVPIVENKPLARLLFKEVDLNRPIPDKAYAAVAEVLAYVYQLKGKSIATSGRLPPAQH